MPIAILKYNIIWIAWYLLHVGGASRPSPIPKIDSGRHAVKATEVLAWASA